MNEHFPQGGIQALILDRKGDRSYERLARDCGYDIKSRALHAAATKQTKAFADPGTIRGLSHGLNVPVTDIIRAYAISLGLPVVDDEKGVLRIIGAGELPRSAQDLLLSMARELIAAHAQPWGQEDEPAKQDLGLAAHMADENVGADEIGNEP